MLTMRVCKGCKRGFPFAGNPENRKAKFKLCPRCRASENKDIPPSQIEKRFARAKARLRAERMVSSVPQSDHGWVREL